MNRFGILTILLIFLGMQAGLTQVSLDCGNAIPICNNTPVNGGTNGFGIDDFNGDGASGCLERTTSGAIESNAAWYRFRTGASGQLGFNIGFDASEDWDFALYRVDDCNALGNPIRCNFFDNTDNNSFVGVGEDPTGDVGNFQYEDWLQVTPGEDYYLLINNFSNTNSGFSIQFSGQIFVTNPYDALDCSIISELLGPPVAACEGETVTLDATTMGATVYNWYIDTGAGFQPIVGQNNATLVVTTTASYRVQVITPSNNNIVSEVQVAFSPVPIANPISDAASCSGLSTFDLSQKDAEVLGAQDPNSYVVSYYADLGDANNATNALPKQYITQAGAQTIYVRVSSINNPNCFDVSEQFQLVNLESPILDFPSEAYLCAENGSVTIGLDLLQPNYSYAWDSGETTAEITVSQPGAYTLTVTNTQGGLSCDANRTVTVTNSNPPQIMDVLIEDLQKNNTVTVVANAEGPWEYQLDDRPFQTGNVFANVTPGTHSITVNDPNGCGSVTEEIVVVGFPKYFTPNADGMNDHWGISGIENLEDPEIYIFDRYGKLLNHTIGSNGPGWDGTFNGKRLPAADYWFKLTYIDSDGQRSTAKYVNNHFSLKR
ncbi:T9SS type B sorting domain-containing protein [Flavobacteriaceae bacterium TP-CH-4]|uniref:T9SS type B sorting domain-containing protein n=2 Tax=Pelagihabitans pacificus TaxID=2696054 RepID=A0A967AQ67_9FLAO|nr:T9SS type B sorting domain-containing protein [Pelagihabitans pacificus]